jgi:hypothetical protein
MASGYDFAIFGASPLAALLAGLLAHDHGKQVIRIAEPISPQRLPRAIDIALPLATRPETWRLMRAAQAETLAILGSLGAREAIVATDLKVVADQPGTAAALAHASHMAAGYGLAVRDGVFSRISRLVGDITLADSKVQSVETAALDLEGGAARLIVGEEIAEAGQIILADDASILAYLTEKQRPSLLLAESMTATLTAPARRLAAPIMRFPDRGVTLAQRPDHAVLALVSGDTDVEARLASALPGPFPLPRRASSRSRRLVSADGAPVIGWLKPSKLMVIAGMGNAGAFLAPPLARLLAGKASDEERAYFAAHAPEARREAVADFVEAQQ